MSMDQASLVADLKASLMDAAQVFTAANDADFKRHLDMAAQDLGRFRKRTVLGEITLQADVAAYDAPSDLLHTKLALWGQAARRASRPWEKAWPGRLPSLSTVESAAGGLQLYLIPAPTAGQIAQLGAAYPFYYYAAHKVAAGAADTTVRPGDRGLLLLRAQAEAMKEVAVRNLHKPTSMRDGITSAPRNGTPAALHKQLMDEFERMAATC